MSQSLNEMSEVEAPLCPRHSREAVQDPRTATIPGTSCIRRRHLWCLGAALLVALVVTVLVDHLGRPDHHLAGFSARKTLGQTELDELEFENQIDDESKKEIEEELMDRLNDKIQKGIEKGILEGIKNVSKVLEERAAKTINEQVEKRLAKALRTTTVITTSTSSSSTLVPTTTTITAKLTTVAAVSKSDTPAPDSLFCFSVMNVDSYELSLMRSQLSQGAGIFSCNTWSVFSDRKTWLSPGPPVRIENTVLDIAIQATAGKSTHFLNTDVFAKAWSMVHKEGKYKSASWTLKVDPDAVLFPDRLRQHVRSIPGYTNNHPKGVFVLNCLYNDHKYWFFGALEVFSAKALETYFAGSETCMKALDRGELGEDTWMRKCLDILQVDSIKDTGLLSDGYCNEAPSPCVSGKVAFHPFKNAEAYFACHNEAKAADSKQFK